MSSAIAQSFGFMNSFVRDNALINNASTGLTQFQILRIGHPWKDRLIKGGYDRYDTPQHRWEVMHTDPIALFLWSRFGDEITAKPFKSYEVDETGESQEIMMDIWERWERLNMNILFKEILKYLIIDGYCLNELYLTSRDGIGFHNYGYFHTQPELWDRRNSSIPELFEDHNKIARYKIWYVPHPLGVIYNSNYNMHAVERYIIPAAINLPALGYEFNHFTRIAFNEGLGYPRAQGVWSSITKLRKYSWSDFRRSLGLPQLEFPSTMDPDVVEEMMSAVAKWDESEGLAIPKYVNPQTQETEDFPRYFERTPDQTGAVAKADPSSGGTLLRSAEWALFLAYTGYSETKIVGSQPGAVEGSKLDLTRDDRVDIREFQNYVPVMKTILLWLLKVGKLEGCDPESMERIMMMDYDIKCHIEWEILENQMAEAEAMEAEAEDQASIGEDRGNSLERLNYNYNTALSIELLICLRNNAAMPMRAVGSSWIKGIGYKDDYLYMELHSGDKYRYDSADAGAILEDWVDSGSKGGFWWDRIRDKLSPADKVGRIPLPKFGGYEEYQRLAEEMKKFKMEGAPGGLGKGLGLLGAGETREGFGAAPKTVSGPEIHTIPAAGPDAFSLTGKTLQLKEPLSPHLTKPQPRRGPKAKRGAKSKKQKAKAFAPAPATGKTAIHYNSIAKMSYNDLNDKLHEKYGAGMGKTTFTNLKRYFDEEFNFRYNSMAIGKPMDFDIDLWYPDDNGGYFNERACKREWDKIEDHKGILKLYENQAHGGKHIIVGTYEYKADNVLIMDYDKDLILNNVPEDSKIAMRINEGLVPEMSTEYYTGKPVMHDGVPRQVGFHDEQGRPRFRAIAIVNEGNCNSGSCPFEPIDEVEA